MIKEKITDGIVVILFALSLVGSYSIGIMQTTGYGNYGPAQYVSEIDISDRFGESWGNMELVLETTSAHSYTHQYYANVYDCKYMSMSLWDMLTKSGINTKIMVGSPDNANVSALKDTDHVWIIAEVAPGDWIAVEPSGGYLVCSSTGRIIDIRSGNSTMICEKDNPLYYRGWIFENPRDLVNGLKGW